MRMRRNFRTVSRSVFQSAVYDIYVVKNCEPKNLLSKISTKNHCCPHFFQFSTLCMRSMFLQVDANGLHENGDILPAIILLRVKTACPENALNLLRGKMQA